MIIFGIYLGYKEKNFDEKNMKKDIKAPLVS
jgi:hypothetical protein